MVYIFYFHHKILKDKDLTFTCRNTSVPLKRDDLNISY